MGEKRELRREVATLEARLREKTVEAETTASGLEVAKLVIDEMDDHITKLDEEIKDLQTKLLAESITHATNGMIIEKGPKAPPIDVPRLAAAWAKYDGVTVDDDYLADAKGVAKNY